VSFPSTPKGIELSAKTRQLGGSSRNTPGGVLTGRRSFADLERTFSNVSKGKSIKTRCRFKGPYRVPPKSIELCHSEKLFKRWEIQKNSVDQDCVELG